MKMNYGGDFQRIETLWRGDEEGVSIINSEHDKYSLDHIIHPSFLDSCFQAYFMSTREYLVSGLVFQSIDVMELYVEQYFPKKVLCHCVATEITNETSKGNILVYDMVGNLIMKILGFQIRFFSVGDDTAEDICVIEMQTKALPEIDICQYRFDPDFNYWEFIVDGVKKEKNIDLEKLSSKKEVIFEASKFLEEKLKGKTKFSGKEIMNKIKEFCDGKGKVNSDTILSELIPESMVTKKTELEKVFEGAVKKLIDDKRIVRILEVNSGKRRLFEKLFDIVKPYAGLIEYYITDPSFKMLEEISDLVIDEKIIRFKTFDMEEEYSQSGLKECFFDIVVASDITKMKMSPSLSAENLSMALSMNGILLLLEETKRVKSEVKMEVVSNKEWKEILEENEYNNIGFVEEGTDKVLIVAKKFGNFGEKVENHVLIENPDPFSLVEKVKGKAKEDLDYTFIVPLKNVEMNLEYAELYGVAKTIVSELPWDVKILNFEDEKEYEKREMYIEDVIENPLKYEIHSTIKNGEVFVPRIHQMKFEGKTIDVKSGIFVPDKTYIISGGLGAVGFELVKKMESLGAKYFVLLSRSCRTQKKHERVFEDLESRGASVFVSKTDITKEEDVREMYEKLTEHKFPPVKGVYHLAMVLRDEDMENMTRKDYDLVVNTKKRGAMNLIKPLKPSKDIDIFLFSSIVGVFGNKSQANYNAANTYMEKYANVLSERGFNAKVINLGSVEDVGVIATDFKLRKVFRSKGIIDKVYSVNQLINTIVDIHQFDDKKRVQYLVGFKLGGFSSTLSPLERDLYTHLVPIKFQKRDKNESGLTYDALNKVLKEILLLNEDIDPEENLLFMGVDSIQSLELALILQRDYGLGISQLDIVNGITMNEILKCDM